MFQPARGTERVSSSAGASHRLWRLRLCVHLPSEKPFVQRKAPVYIATTHGILTALETLGAVAVMVLYLLMGHTVTYKWYAHAAFLLAFTYCLNNMLVIISAVASPTTQNHLQQTLYYSLYLCTAGLLFLVGCAVFYGVDRGDSLRFRNITGVSTKLVSAGEVRKEALLLLPELLRPAVQNPWLHLSQETVVVHAVRQLRRAKRPRCSASSYSICAMAGAPWCCEPSRLLFGWPRPPVPPNGAVHH
ncbi:hypothetical protein MRX96_018525 [Rhipicephalus microplus]